MKKIKLYFPTYISLICTATVVALTASSCEEALEENPKAVAVETFYNTPQEVEAAVNAIYTPIRNEMANYTATLDAHSDFMYGRGSWEPLSLYQGMNDANITRVSGFWSGFYVTIRNANLVIQNAPAGSSIGQADIDRFVAEARFLRAYTYFHLVRNWGAIPLRTESNMNEKDVPRSSEADVYALIMSDLENAETYLPDNPAAAGRPTRWSAKTLLADVYLQLQRYADAAAKANEVIGSNKFSLVRVSNKSDIQNNIFGPTIVTSTEEVFYFKYSRLENQGNYILWISNHPSTGLFNFGGAYAIHGNATNPIYVNWDDADLRKSMLDKIDFGLGPNTLVSSKYVDRSAVSLSGSGNDFPAYRYADVLLIYAEAASRAEQAVSAQAMEAVNKVHRRAYGFDPAVPSSVDFEAADYTPATFLDLVMRERVYEFVFEGKRWLELKRTGRASELIQASKNRTIAPSHMLWPIPLSEINYNNAIAPSDQNPGY